MSDSNVMSIPLNVETHLRLLGIGDAGIALVEKEVLRASFMMRDELKSEIDKKNQAIKYLRIQQAVFLAALEERAENA